MIGYKPQLVRSENGFVTSLLVPEGNAADAIELVPAIADSIKRTGVVADLVSTDDGYASANGRDDLLNCCRSLLLRHREREELERAA